MKYIDITQARHAFQEWKYAAAEEKRWKGIKDQYWQEMQDRVGENFDDADALMVDGKPVLQWTSREEKRIEIADLREQYPEIADKLEKTKPKRISKAVEE